jgi:predicted peptidase
MRHLVSLPAGPGPHPLLCFLHGYDEAAPAPIDEALRRHGPLRSGNPARITEQFIVLAPQLPQAGDVWRQYSANVRTLVEGAVARYGADLERLYLTGFSYGANGVLDLALVHPGIWAALWPVDPTRAPTRDPRVPVWLSFGEIARARKSRFIAALRLKPVSGETRYDRLYGDCGDDHIGAARRAYGDARIYDWLLRHRHEAPGLAFSQENR